jgi:hypothetical protein
MRDFASGINYGASDPRKANCAKSFVTREGVESVVKRYVVPKVGLPWPEWIKT